jgi:hypothetical protein
VHLAFKAQALLAEKGGVEACVGLGWKCYTGSVDAVVGLTGFGASAPGIIAKEKFGFTAGCVAEAVLRVFEKPDGKIRRMARDQMTNAIKNPGVLRDWFHRRYLHIKRSVIFYRHHPWPACKNYYGVCCHY